MKKIGISIGDLNGIGLELALKSHNEVKKLCNPLYFINQKMLEQGAKLLNLKIPENFEIYETNGYFKIEPATISAQAGLYSFTSFLDAINLAKDKKIDAISTLPINKESWMKAGIKYKGHTEVLRDIFKKDAIMMLGNGKLNVALFTEHIPIKNIAKNIKKDELVRFFRDFNNSIKTDENIYVLSLNPHNGDGGVLGDEEINEIIPAINEINKELGVKKFIGTLVPDTAFINPKKYYIAMYHDQGLIPLKALCFEDSVNISLNLPIIRTSVDHGTAFDIAYNDKLKADNKSYINSIKMALSL